MFKAALYTIYGANDVRDATGSVVACAKRIFRAATAGRGSEILLRIIAFSQGMEIRFLRIDRARANGLARYQVEFLQYNDMRAGACTAALEATIRDEQFTLICRRYSALSCRLLGDERYL